jgi:chromosome segregation ATPase
LNSLKKEKEKNENLLNEKCSNLEKSKDKLDSERIKLTEQLASSQSQLKMFTSKTDDVSKQIIEKLELEKKELHNSKETLKNELNQVQKEKTTLQSDFDSTKKQIKTLEDKIDDLQYDIEEMGIENEKKMKDYQHKLDQLMIEKDHSESEVFRVKNELKKSEDEIKNLKNTMLTQAPGGSVSILKKKEPQPDNTVLIKNLKTENENLNIQIEDLKKEINQIRKEKESATKSESKSKLEIENLETEKRNLILKQEEILYELKEAKGKIDELRIYEVCVG